MKSLLRILALFLGTSAAALAAPVNDAFSAGIVLSGTSGTTAGTNVTATGEPGEPLHAGFNGSRSVWWRLTPAAATQFTINTTGSNYDTLLAVYTGSAVNALTSIVSNDDNPAGGTQSTVTFAASAGVTYHIAVDGYSAATGNITLNWNAVVPANNNFASAQNLTGRTGVVTGSNAGATAEAGEPNSGNSVWYRWTAPAAFSAFIKTEGSSFDTVLAIYTGTALNALTQAAFDDNSGPAGTSRVEFPVTAGTVYRIQVRGAAAAAGSIRLAWGEQGFENIPLLPDIWVMSAPLNDWFIDQTQIPGRTLIRLTTTTPNTGAGPLELRGTQANPGVMQRIYHGDGSYHERLAGTFTFHPTHGHLHFDDWVQFHLRTVLPGNAVGPIVVSGGKTSFAVIDLEVHDLTLPGAPGTGQYGGGLVQGLSVGYRDVYGAHLDGQWIDVTAVQPGQYWLEGVVDPDNHIEESDEANNATRILITYNGSVPPNNAFASPAALTGRTAGANGRNISATKEASEPAHAGNTGGASIWYTWTAPASGATTLSTAGSTFDTLLAVYTGTAVGSLTAIASNDNDGALTTSRLTFTAVSGTTYRIAVDGKAGASGLVEIALNPALNDPFAAPLVITGTSGTAGGSIREATAESGEPDHASTPAAASLWYQWTAPLTGDATFNTRGSSADTRLAIYTGSALNALTLIASDDDSGINRSASVSFHIDSGTTYRIAADGDPGILALGWTAGTALVPTIVTEPAGANIPAGATINLSVTAVGSPQLTYEWRHGGALLINGPRISGATTNTLSITRAALTDAGGYQCTVRNPAGTDISTTATILVVANPRVLFADFAQGDIGGTVTIPLLLQSQNNEHSVSFTVQWDPLLLNNPSIVAGIDSTGATILTDLTESAAGRCGITLTLPGSTAFAAGLREIADLRLTAAAGTPGGTVTPVGFALGPVAGQAHNAGGNVLPVVFAAGNLTLNTVNELLSNNPGPGAPGMSLRGIAGRSYTIYASDDMATWTPAGTVTIDLTGAATYSDPTPAGRKFYKATLNP